MSDRDLSTPPRGEFSLDGELIYLNHAAVSPWPQRTVRAVSDFALENGTLGSSNYPRWIETEKRLRERLSRLIGAGTADDVALVKNTSEGLSLVAHGLTWKYGENVVTSDQEFPSNSIVWESLSRHGVETRKADLSSANTPEEALFEAVDRNTRLLSISSVQFGSGLRMDLERIGSFCRARGILFCVDAIQSLGAIQMDGAAIRADFIVADGHKWMMAPEGCALFYSTPEARERLQLQQYGWHMREALYDFETGSDNNSNCEQPGCCADIPDWTIANSARRFEPGSPNMLGIHGLEASLSLIEEVGMEQIERLVLERSQLLIDSIQRRPQLELITPTGLGRFAGIVTFSVKTGGLDSIHNRLTEKGIQCAVRSGGIRFSPHFYTPMNQLEEAMRDVDSLVGQPQTW